MDPMIIDGTRCCLCKIDVPSHRKTNLNGKATSAIETKQYLQQFLSDVFETNIASTELSSIKIGLCRKCIDQVRKMKADAVSLEVRKSRLKDQLVPFVQELAHEAQSSGASPLSSQACPLQRKRNISATPCDSYPAQYLALATQEDATPIRSEKRQPSHVGVNIYMYITFCVIFKL